MAVEEKLLVGRGSTRRTERKRAESRRGQALRNPRHALLSRPLTALSLLMRVDWARTEVPRFRTCPDRSELGQLQQGALLAREERVLGLSLSSAAGLSPSGGFKPAILDVYCLYYPVLLPLPARLKPLLETFSSLAGGYVECCL